MSRRLKAGLSAGLLLVCAAPVYADEAPESEITVLWNDPGIGIDWPLSDPEVSEKDAAAEPLSALDPALLPIYTESE